MVYAIPTKWNGVQFRSRLEARWASFFTKLGWEWSYEPVDLEGYIPDFLLHMHHDVLVEVKPYTRLDDDVIEAAHEKITEGGWGEYDDAIVVGARLFDAGSTLCLGVMRYGDKALVGQCDLCSLISLASDCMDFSCRRCGENSGNEMALDIGDRKRVFSLWLEAGNEVQWRGR